MDMTSFILGTEVGSGGGGGTSDYEDLNNKPTINGVTLQGALTSGDLGIETVQYSTMPTASADNAGQIVQFVGATDTYTNGYFYKCVENGGVYSWEAVNVQAGGGGSSVTVTPVVTEGTKVAEIEVNNVTSNIYSTDEWSSVELVDSNNTVTFTGLSDNRAYSLFVENKVATVTGVTKTGSGTSVSLAYALSGVLAGDRCKLRIVGETVLPGPRLPGAYQEVEYLEGTGTQYINTELVTSSGWRIACTIEFNSLSGTAPMYFGSCALSSGWSYSEAGVFISVGNKFVVGDGAFYQGSGVTAAINTRYEISASNLDLNSPSLIVNGTSLEMAVAPDGAGSGRSSAVNYLFARNHPSGNNFPMDGKIYGDFKVYTSSDNSQLVAHFVPCVRKADNVAGMYDLVRNTFYTNAGTGSFIAGPAVE